MTLTETIALIWVLLLAAFCFIWGRLVTKQTPRQQDEAYYRRVVSVAGGVYVGIQECDVDHSLDCVLFNSPISGSTLAVKVKDFTAVAVEMRLEEHAFSLEEYARRIV